MSAFEEDHLAPLSKARLLGLLLIGLGALFYFMGLVPFETKDHAAEQRGAVEAQIAGLRHDVDRLDELIQESRIDRARLTERVLAIQKLLDGLEIDTSVRPPRIYRRPSGGEPR